jgi:hypothetical protein
VGCEFLFLAQIREISKYCLARCFDYDVSVMHDLAMLVVHLVVTVARLFGPGGARSWPNHYS